MSKDFKYRAHADARRPFPVWRLLITGLFIAAFLGFLLFVDSEEPSDPSDAARSSVSRAKAPSKAADAPQKVESKPRFEFYTLLPEKEIYVPPPEVTKRPAKPDPKPPPTPSTIADASVTYLLQVAASRDAREADRLRAKLLLLGFDVRVQTTTIDHKTWHRVRVGPFQGLDQVNEARARLSEDGVNAIVVKLGG